MIIYCIVCNTPHNNPRFCSKSCSASYNNKGKRRHGQPPNNCKECGNLTRSSKHVFCSVLCSAASRKKDAKHLRATNRELQSRYRAKKYRVIDPTANKTIIKEIYKNCPAGYEVDHIIPLSKGGKHHEDNLQYLPMLENRRKNNRLVGPPRFELRQ